MPTVQICSFNVEWMNDWFTPDADPNVQFRPTFKKDGHTSDTAETATRTAAVIRAVDPDVLAIEEGPSRLAELELFVHDYLSDGGQPRYECFLSDTGMAQRVGLLYKPGSVDAAQLAPHSQIQGLIDEWEADVDGDAVPKLYHFTRNPLVVDLTIGGNPLQVIVMHTKSNFVQDGEGLWKKDQHAYTIAALLNRRRNSSEGMRVREYLDSKLAQDGAAAILVCGDLNDGPGLDYFEEIFLSHNVTDILVGSAFEPEWIFTHAQHDVPAADRYTAIFDDFVTNEKDKHLLLDHILLSPGLAGGGAGLRQVKGSGRVRHAEYDAEVANGGANREDRPSDHRPVSVELEYD